MKKSLVLTLGAAAFLGGSLLAQSVQAEERPIPMYRLYNPNSGEHFYTSNVTEAQGLVDLRWGFEGIGWVAIDKGEDVYRLYNPNAGDHHYTLSASEKDSLVAAGWKYEGVSWKSAGTLPLYRLYNPNAKGAGSHHYTLLEGERDSLVALGWQYEGLAWNAAGKGVTAEEYFQLTNQNSNKPSTPAASTPSSEATTNQTTPYYKTCADVKNAGKAPIRRGEPGYGSHLDRDGDGVGCEIKD